MIEIHRPILKNNRICYDISTSSKLDKYFNEKHSFIEHINIKEDFSTVPEGISIIPILCNVLPVSWILNTTIFVNELDKDFFDSIKIIKKNFSEMFPEIKFKGELIVKNIVDYENNVSKDKYASFFSGGIDSTFTIINNLHNKPDLLTIWGSDIPIDEVDGWENLSNTLNQTGKELDLKNIFIKSDFRKLLNTPELNKVIAETGESWWYALQHGISIISHSVIYAYKNKIGKILIASSFSPSDLKEKKVTVIPCASSPNIDNNFRFSNSKVIHEGFEYTRQEKTRTILKYSEENNKKIDIRVCWETTDGKNCSKCLKCSKTIMGILAEKQNPNHFGFDFSEDYLKEIKKQTEDPEKIW